MIKRLFLISAAACLATPTIANAHAITQTHFLETAKPYAPYEFLIGDWYSKLPGTDMAIHQQFKWGPGKSYLVYASYLVPAGKAEQLHFEGMMVWNGKSKKLDFLFAVQPGSGDQEKGTVEVQADGSIVRTVELTGADADRDQLRQIFRKLRDGKVTTSVMEQTVQGWTMNPPGEIVMDRAAPAEVATAVAR